MCIKTKDQAIISPSKIEGAGGSMMISSKFPHRSLCHRCSYSPKSGVSKMEIV